MDIEDRVARSHCCDGRIVILLKQFTTIYGEKLVWQCLTCGNIYAVGNKEESPSEGGASYKL